MTSTCTTLMYSFLSQVTGASTSASDRMKAAKDLDGDYKYYTLDPSKARPYKARRGACQGGYECTNPQCEDMTGDGTKNTSSFVCPTESNMVTCKMCKLATFTKHHPCMATRTVMLPDQTADAWIVDEGQHLSTCKSLKTRLSSATAISELHDQLNCGPKKVILSSLTTSRFWHNLAVGWWYVQWKISTLLHLIVHEHISGCARPYIPQMHLLRVSGILGSTTSWDVVERI